MTANMFLFFIILTIWMANVPAMKYNNKSTRIARS